MWTQRSFSNIVWNIRIFLLATIFIRNKILKKWKRYILNERSSEKKKQFLILNLGLLFNLVLTRKPLRLMLTI